MLFSLFDDVVHILTSRASDKCQREKRKTINGDDLLWAMATLGFEDYIDPLKVYLMRYREVCSSSAYSVYIKRISVIHSLTLCFSSSFHCLCYMDWDFSDGG